MSIRTRILAGLAGLLLAGPAPADGIFNSSSTFAVGTFGAGLATAPSIVFSGSSMSGWYAAAPGYVSLTINSNLVAGGDPTPVVGFEIYNNSPLKFAAPATTADASIVRTGVGALMCGNGSGVAGCSFSATNFQPAIIYSAAGTALPACGAGSNGWTAVVSDSTAPTYRNAYTSGGAVTARVLCVNGTGWVND